MTSLDMNVYNNYYGQGTAGVEEQRGKERGKDSISDVQVREKVSLWCAPYGKFFTTLLFQRDIKTEDYSGGYQDQEDIDQENVDVRQVQRQICIEIGSDSDSEHEEGIGMVQYIYSIKIVNPVRMKEYCNIVLGKGTLYRTLKSLRKFIMNNMPNVPDVDKPDLSKVEWGYVEPGHGMKGKKIWLYTDGDLRKMYEGYGGKPTIRLWAYTSVTRKEPSKPEKKKAKLLKEDSSKVPTKKASKFDNRQDEVDSIYEDLEERHTGNFSKEQLRTWAYMIRMKTHASYEVPPQKAFFTGHKRQERDSSPPESKRHTPSTTVTVSPARKVNMHSELIDQLQKWHQLLDLNVITETEYDELKEKIMLDIQKV